MKIAVVTDSTAVITDEMKHNERLRVLKVPVMIDGEPQFDVAPGEFYKRLKNAKEFPTTSQPSMGEAEEIYQELADEGYDAVISIHISSGISGFYQNLVGEAKLIESIKVIPFDSRSTSLPMGVMVETALRLIERGDSLDQVMEALEKMRQYQCIYLVVDDLHHLVRSGRLSNGSALIGSLLKIKPVLRFDEHGDIVVFEKIRTAKKAYRRVEDLVIEEKNYYEAHGLKPILGIAHADYEDKAFELADHLSERSGLPVRVVDLGTVIGTHTGAKTIGMGIMLDVE